MTELAGLRVLIVEDEELVSMLIEGMLDELGCETVGTVDSVKEALQALETLPLEVAVLDFNLRGVEAFPVAEALSGKGVPFVFSSGYGAAGVPERFRGTPVIPKPFRIDELETALRRAVDG